MSKRIALGILSAALLVTACSSAGRFNPFSGYDEEKRLEEERDRAGRIAMVQDNELEPDPELVSTTVDIGLARPVTQWAQAGATAAKVIGHIEAAPEFKVDWSKDVGQGTTRIRALTAPPVAANGKIAILDGDQKVVVLDAETGREVWSKRLKSLGKRDKYAFGGGVAIAADQLIVASGFGYISMFDLETGNEIWKQEIGTPMTGAPTVHNDRVFVVSNNNELFSLSLATGEIQWTDQAIAEPARVLSSPSVAAVEDFLVTPYSSGELIAYLAANGRRLWTDSLTRSGRFTPISQINDIASRPVLTRGLVFAASQSGILAAIDGRSGQRVWALPFGSTQSPVIGGEYVFAVSVDGQLICVQATTGRVVWIQELERFTNEKKSKGRIAYSGPILASGRVVLASSQGELIAFSPQTGEEVDRLRVGKVGGRISRGKGAVFIEPIAYEGRLYILRDDAKLVAVR